MSPWDVGGLTLFILVLLCGTFSILFGFPGTVIIFLDALLYGAVTGFERIGFKILLALLILSALAEVTDFAVGMTSAVKIGPTRKGVGAFLAGGLVGALLLSPFLLGLGLIVGIFSGGFAAMLTVELLARRRLKPTLREPWGAILGRSAGVCVKGFIALIMVVITLTSIYS
ncbi:MAG: DUF456 domain-containing protein [Syntrophales bacterium]